MLKKSILGLVLGAASLFSADCFFFTPQMIESHLTTYNDAEKAAIAQDLEVVHSICLPELTGPSENRRPVYLATAGAPGARKSTILERFIRDHVSLPQIAYIDPDQRTLKFMAHTYYSQSLSALQLGSYSHYATAVKNAYEKWRGASNYISLTLLEEAFAERRHIAHGTTLTGEHVSKFLSTVKDAGYDITLLLCSCEDDFRYNAIQYRNEEQRFYQCSPEDAVSKGKAFPQRMSAYFTFADTIYLFWSDDLATQERLAAKLTHGNLEVLDAQAFDLFVQKFEEDREMLTGEDKQILSWDELLDLYRSRFL